MIRKELKQLLNSPTCVALEKRMAANVVIHALFKPVAEGSSRRAMMAMARTDFFQNELVSAAEALPPKLSLFFTSQEKKLGMQG